MDVQGENRDRVLALLRSGVEIMHPESVWIDRDVVPDRISRDAVIYPGCRLLGRETWIGPGARLGEEAPATVVDCQVGPGVVLKGGYFRRSTFLDGVSMGSGAQVREGCLLEEEASGAHTVGIKQTILFPFVTLGSLINFCDCLMAGGTSRKDHSEVGSSYIHFNYTPHQDKATPSLFGDVPAGVMLDRKPIFLGGQGGTVGPSRLGYGVVVAAGSIVRRDCVEGNRLLKMVETSGALEFQPGLYRNVKRVVRNNVIYIANLHALALWYDQIRRLFHGGGRSALYEGAAGKVGLALEERIKRFRGLAENMKGSIDLAGAAQVDEVLVNRQKELLERWPEIEQCLENVSLSGCGAPDRDRFVKAIEAGITGVGRRYLEVIQRLEKADREAGTRWLEAVVSEVVKSVDSVLLSF